MNPTIPTLPATAAPRKRSAWEIQRGVLFALLLREMKGRVGGQWVGAIWTLIEPLMHVLVVLGIYTALRASSLPGVELPVFMATGLVPFFLFQNLATRLMDGIVANRGLYAYRQVKPFDTLMSRALVEAIMNVMVYAVTLGLLGWLGFRVLPAGPLEMIGVHLVLFALGVGYGTFAAVVTHDRPRLRSFLRISMLPLYILSGIIFPVHLAPPDTLHWMLFNPLLHLIELSRHAFIPEYRVVDGANLVYPLLFTLGLCTLALTFYRADRLRLVTST